MARRGRGNIAIVTAFILPMLVGAFGLGVEIGFWYWQQRGMQNAADAAALAAATNGTATYAGEALAVAARYGFSNGANNVTVAASNAAVCPSGGSNCYSVTITSTVPQVFSQLVGYAGNGQGGVSLTATAVATQGTVQTPFCLLGTGTSGQDVTCNGCPKSNLSGCSIMSDANLTCNGHDMGASFGLAVGTAAGCGAAQKSNVPPVSDPYAGLAGSIPANICGGAYPGGNLNGASVWPATKVLCGNQTLTGDVVVPKGTVVVIENGYLDLNGHTFDASAGATVILTGTAGAYDHFVTDLSHPGKGTINITAPTSGTWSGIALYQDPALTSGLDMSFSGNMPTFNIFGVVDVSKADLTVRACGSSVTATTTHVLDAVVYQFSIPLSATACHP
ncbi:MAG TPA: hypothetical protein HPQ04_11120 [Rhodospirillaceae bacterium]|nr:hypothetical protein [Rhodospirillaceae bacterium]